MNRKERRMIYQIDYSAASSGKMVSLTKRRIRWRWGTANTEALAEGKVGVECRGFEHEITLVWSITSGKRLIIHDSNEVHYSVGRRGESKFQHSWNYNEHIFTIIAYASTPLSGTKTGFKQFELLIDGMSYDSFPRIYELGTSGGSCSSISTSSRGKSRNASSARRAAYAEHRSDGESRRPTLDQELQWARRVHAIESGRSMNMAFAHGNGKELTNDRFNSGQQSSSPPPSPPPVVEDLISTSAVSLLDMESPSNEDANSFWEQSAHGHNYNPSQPPNQPPNQPPTYEAVWSSIMDAYDRNGGVNDVAPVSSTVITTTMSDMSNLQITTSDDLPKHCGTSVDSPRDVADINDMMSNLVNLDDISSKVIKGFSKEKFDLEQKEKLRTKSLHELKSMHNSGTNSTTSGQSKEIMKTHQYSQQPVGTNPGSVVVYGHPNQQQPQSFTQQTYNAPFMYNAY